MVNSSLLVRPTLPSVPGSQACPELDQQIIAGGVAPRIVDVLEVVDVEVDHANRRRRQLIAGQASTDLLEDGVAIQQAGQQIDPGVPVEGDPLTMGGGDGVRPNLRPITAQVAITERGINAPMRRSAVPFMIALGGPRGPTATPSATVRRDDLW